MMTKKDLIKQIEKDGVSVFVQVQPRKMRSGLHFVHISKSDAAEMVARFRSDSAVDAYRTTAGDVVFKNGFNRRAL
jgi:hypothetical protein